MFTVAYVIFAEISPRITTQTCDDEESR